MVCSKAILMSIFVQRNTLLFRSCSELMIINMSAPTLDKFDQSAYVCLVSADESY